MTNLTIYLDQTTFQLVEMTQSVEDTEAGSGDTLPDASSAYREPLPHGHDLALKRSSQLENWDDDSENPYNWSTGRKVKQVVMLSFAAFTT